ncbi:MAG: hypothetical protein L6264_10980 [Weeksellaceae bacterium]|nr:hypothetical protein [Weeksellaceae bacterium]
MWNKIPDDIDILVTHSPPYGILDEVDPGVHVGCEELLEKVNLIQPKYHLYGHIHENYGIKHTEVTTFINGSLLDEHYKMKNQPVVFEG